MQDYKPSLATRAALALRVFRQGLPGTKSAPFLWPDFSTGRPIWHSIDFQSYVAEGFNLNTLVYESIMYKVRAMTAAPLRAYKGDEENPELLPPEHQLTKLLARPNEHQSWAEFHGQNICYKNIAGNYYVYLDGARPGVLPTAMYSLRPDRMYLIPQKKGKRFALMGYMYVPEGKDWRDGTPFLPYMIMHVKFPNPSDPYEGMGEGLSPMSCLARSADVDNQITRYLKLFFDKGAMQAGALSFDVPLTETTVANLREQFGETYGGTDNWMKPIVLDQGGKYQRMSLSFDEMGFEGLDERNESRILGPFGVPPVLVGSRIGLENSPWSNIGEARRIFWEDTMLPESRLDEVEYDYYLGGKGIFLRFDVSDVPALRKDIAGQVEAAYKLWTMGVPRDHALSTVGLSVESVEGGDVSYLPRTMLPAGEKKEEPLALPEPTEEEEPEKSYPAPHYGRPGLVGGSRPRGTGASSPEVMGIIAGTADYMTQQTIKDNKERSIRYDDEWRPSEIVVGKKTGVLPDQTQKGDQGDLHTHPPREDQPAMGPSAADFRHHLLSRQDSGSPDYESYVAAARPDGSFALFRMSGGPEGYVTPEAATRISRKISQHVDRELYAFSKQCNAPGGGGYTMQAGYEFVNQVMADAAELYYMKFEAVLP